MWLLKTNHISLSKILEPNVQFEVPIYQRTYDWNKKHCKQLYDDIIKAGKSEQEQFHFIGAATYVGEINLPNIDVSYYQVVDGQQRLATLMLLLRALKDSLDESEKFVKKEKIDQLLFNINEKKDDKNYYKLILTDDDDKTFKDIMDNGQSESSNNITTNFKYFTSWLTKENNNDIIWRGIRRLTIVQILINEKDDAQAIFESMNSTGLDLSETDMIQNYLLMSEKPEWQKRIYLQYWRPMERRFGEEQNEYFEDFLRNYMMMYRGKIVSKKEMYEYFKIHMSNRDKEKEIKKMYKHSQYYANLINILPHSSDKLKKVIKHIYDQDTNVASSLLLKLLADHANGIITEKECESVFLLVDSYLLRCHVCDTTKGGNKVFPETIPKIVESDYVKSIEKTLMSKTGNRRFPRNAIFKENLERLQLYNNRTMCRYMLGRLEHEKSREQLVDTVNLTIEHIMPQTLNVEWKNDLGEDVKDIHEKYLHTIGNITLTAYNQNLGNKSFSEKREIYEKSNVTLTRDLSKYPYWDMNKIKERTQSLIEQAVNLWKCPDEYDSQISSLDTNYDRGLYESEYLEGKNITELWDVLKEKILSTCNGTVFRMTKTYGSFRLPIANSSIGICSIEARNTKIYLTYNTKIQDKIINVSKFVRDISNIGHYGVGDLRSTIMSNEDITMAVNLVKTIYKAKKP